MKAGSSAKGKGAAAEQQANPAVEALFDSLADPEDTELITMEGLQALGARLDLDPSSDVRFLVLLWKLGAQSKPGCVTRAEFRAGMHTMRKESVEALKKSLPSFDPGFLERNEFRDFYKFVFQFSRDGTRKSIGECTWPTNCSFSPFLYLTQVADSSTPSPCPPTPRPADLPTTQKRIS